MKTIKLSVLASALLLIVSVTNAQNASSILKQMDNVLFAPKDMKGKLKIILIDKKGKSKSREAISMQKGIDKKLFRFTAPSSQAGISTLSLPNDLMYLYLPAFGKERRISSSVKSQKFAGTDFSYDDMEAKLYSEKYTPTLIKTENDVLILELKPITKKSEYSKLRVKIDKNNYYPTFIEYYDKGGKKIKEATFKFEKIGKYWNNKEIVMVDLKKNHTTKMIKTDVQFDIGLSDDDFTVRKLKQ